MGNSTISMAMFNSYVKFPEGMSIFCCILPLFHEHSHEYQHCLPTILVFQTLYMPWIMKYPFIYPLIYSLYPLYPLYNKTISPVTFSILPHQAIVKQLAQQEDEVRSARTLSHQQMVFLI